MTTAATHPASTGCDAFPLSTSRRVSSRLTPIAEMTATAASASQANAAYSPFSDIQGMDMPLLLM